MLKIEFSRVDPAGDSGLTLVMDPKHGAACRTYYALSKQFGGEIASSLTSYGCHSASFMALSNP